MTQNESVSFIRVYRHKAKIRNWFSIASFVMIFVVLTVGVLIFLFAAKISVKEMKESIFEFEDHLNHLKSNNQILNQKTDRFMDELYDIESDLRTGVIVLGDSGLRETLLNQTEDLSDDLHEVVEQYGSQLDTLSQISIRYGPQQAALDDYFIISLTTTRVGIVLILIFLVQILLRVYRYNQRTAFYFTAIADAMEMKEAEPAQDFERLVEILSARNIDFRSMPEGPVKDLSGLLRSSR